MNQQKFSSAAGVIFTLITLVHLARIVYGWDAMFNGWSVPMWISWAAVLVTGYLGYQGLKLGKRS